MAPLNYGVMDTKNVGFNHVKNFNVLLNVLK